MRFALSSSRLSALPVGAVLCVGCAVAQTSVVRVAQPLLPMCLAMLAALALVILFRSPSLWLPGLLGD